MRKFVELQFKLVEYADDGSSIVKKIEMDSHANSLNPSFHSFNIKGTPDEHDVTLLCQLTTILSALAAEIKEESEPHGIF